MMIEYVYQKRLVRTLVGTYDAAGFLFARRRGKSTDLPTTVTVVALHQIGDVILCLPAFKAIQEIAPAARLTFVVGQPASPLIAAAFPDSTIITFDARWQRVVKKTLAQEVDRAAVEKPSHQLQRILEQSGRDSVVVFHPDLKVNQLIGQVNPNQSFGFTSAGGGFQLTQPIAFPESGHQAQRNFALAERFAVTYSLPAPTFRPPSLPVPMAALGEVKRRLIQANLTNRKFVVLHPFARFPTKAWSTERWVKLIDWLIEHQLTPIIVGTQADREDPNFNSDRQLNWAGELNLMETAALCQLSNGFIGIDSGPGHLAAAVNCPVVSIFSSVNDPHRWGPCPNKAAVTILHHPPVDRKRWPLERRDLPADTVGNPYSDGITVEEVIAAAQERLI